MMTWLFVGGVLMLLIAVAMTNSKRSVEQDTDDMILYDMVQDDEEGMIGGGDYYD